VDVKSFATQLWTLVVISPAHNSSLIALDFLLNTSIYGEINKEGDVYILALINTY
jgi:hypothetical protein